MRLKVLPLPNSVINSLNPSLQTHRLFSEKHKILTNSIITNVPVFNKNLWFLNNYNQSWYEVDGICYSASSSDFKEILKEYNHVPLSRQDVKALQNIIKKNKHIQLQPIQELLDFDIKVKMKHFTKTIFSDFRHYLRLKKVLKKWKNI